MIDKGKVLKGLECCLKSWNGACDPECPYNHECRMSAEVFQTVMRDALELLKEQEPRRLKVTENAYGRKFYFCPRCARPIEKSAAIGKPRHCEDCGQELMWE